MNRFILVSCLFMTTLASESQTVKSKIGKGIAFAPKDSSFSVQFNTRFQTQYIGVLDLETNEYLNQFTIRRFRLKFKGFLYDPTIQYKIELALSNRDQGDFFAEHNGAASIVLDAVLKWHFRPGWQLWVGQTKLPGNRERVISSGNLQLVERSRLNSRYNIDRDKGLQLRREHAVGSVVFREIFSISTGEGRNITVDFDTGFDYTFRGEILPFGKFQSKGDYFGADLVREKSPKLSIGLTYDYNVNTNRDRGQLGRFIDTRSNLATIFADVMFKYRGFSTMYEYANKKVAEGEIFGLDTDDNIRYFYTGVAHNIQTGYVFKNNTAIDLRFTKNQPSAINNPAEPGREYVDVPEKRYEIGFSKFIAGHTLKFQSSVVYVDRFEQDNFMLFFAQMEIGF